MCMFLAATWEFSKLIVLTLQFPNHVPVHLHHSWTVIWRVFMEVDTRAPAPAAGNLEWIVNGVYHVSGQRDFELPLQSWRQFLARSSM